MNDFTNEKRKSIALLIDSENFSPVYLEVLMGELREIGDIVVARAYGNADTIKRPEYSDFGINPFFQDKYTSGKNSADIRIAIEAMDILQKGFVDCFCIATSDSDFAPLVMRLKEDNKYIIGAGEEKTPKKFRLVCHQFILVDTILKGMKERAESLKIKKTKTVTSKKVARPLDPRLLDIVEKINPIIDSLKENEGYANFAEVINIFRKEATDFSPKNYGAASGQALPFFKEFLKDYYELTHTGTIYSIRKRLIEKK